MLKAIVLYLLSDRREHYLLVTPHIFHIINKNIFHIIKKIMLF